MIACSRCKNQFLSIYTPKMNIAVIPENDLCISIIHYELSFNQVIAKEKAGKQSKIIKWPVCCILLLFENVKSFFKNGLPTTYCFHIVWRCLFCVVFSSEKRVSRLSSFEVSDLVKKINKNVLLYGECTI